MKPDKCAGGAEPTATKNMQSALQSVAMLPPPPPAASPPPLQPPLLPAPILEAASYTAIVSSAISILATLFAFASLLVNCCSRHRRLPSMLLLVALGACPSDVARVISGVADVLPHNTTVAQWADEWQCRAAAGGSRGGGSAYNGWDGSGGTALNERNCAVLAMAHVLSTAAPLWAASLALHLIGRTICCVTSRAGCGWRCLVLFARLCFCVGVPMLTCAILAADRSCDAFNVPHLPPWASSLCNATHAPHFESWSDLSGGVASSGAAARAGDALPLVLFGSPFALAIGLSLLALLFCPATCAIERVHAAQLQYSPSDVAARGSWARPRRGLEPLCASFAFLALAVPVWLLPLARAAAQLWMDRPPAASEALPWLGVASSAFHPCIGALAVLCWVCGAQRAGRGAATTATRGEGGGAVDVGGLTSGSGGHPLAGARLENAHTGLLNAQPVAARAEAPAYRNDVEAVSNDPGSSSNDAASGGLGGWLAGLFAGGGRSDAAPHSEGDVRGAGGGEPTCQPTCQPLVVHSSPDASSAAASAAGSSSSALHAPLLMPPTIAPGLRAPDHKAGWLYKEGHRTKGWKRRWCVIENGLFQYFESFDSPYEKALGLVPLHGARLGEPKTARSRRLSLGGATIGPAWRLDTAAQSRDAFHQKYVLAGEDVASTEAWKEAMQRHIEFANQQLGGRA